MKGFKDVIILFFIAIIAATLLAYTYMVTKEPIAITAENTRKEALKTVIPFLQNRYESSLFHDQGADIPFYTVTENGQFQGAAIEIVAGQGYSGNIYFLLGVNAKKEITGFKILRHAETPGLGSKAEKQAFWGQFIGKTLDNFHFDVKKDGGDADAITAATITSRAISKGIGRALESYDKYLTTVKPAEAKP